MKLAALIFPVLIVFIFLPGCAKDRTTPDPVEPIIDSLPASTALAGKWLIENDSVYNDGNYFIEFGGTKNYPVPGKYYGAPNDFYDFQSTGDLSLFENGNSYLVSYKISGKQLIISDTGTGADTSDIVSITATSARIEKYDTSVNGGLYFRRLNLKK